jgi:GMP synthase-like glutamine amidotransferase
VIPGLPDRSILYISVVTHPDHPLHGFMRQVHNTPDLDLERYVECLGPGIRRYFAEQVIDGTTMPPPEDLRPYRGVVIGCSLHYFNLVRAPLAAWQDTLVRFARRVIFEEKLPFLGVCGGASIAHLALGGSLRTNPRGPGIDPDSDGSIVIRTTQLTLTEAGQSDPLFHACPAALGMAAAHSDYVADLAPGCRALAHSADIPNQAIAYGDKVRLLPGMHPEMAFDPFRRVGVALAKTGKFGTNPSNSDGIVAALAQIVPTPHANERLLPNFLAEFCADP